MILGPISYVDCLVFCAFLAPRLLIDVGLFGTVACVLRMLPFLLVQLPFSFIHDRFVAERADLSPFTRQASPFEDFVIRCVRYAFAHVPAHIGRVFFSRHIALPFLKFRMLRHGYLRSPVHWREYQEKNFKGVWIVADPTKRPDVVILYAHGGGFSMGSTYFYLEFLITWHSLLREAGYRNPAIFSLEYTLVPDACYPTQLDEAIHAYDHVLAIAGDPSIVVLSGDSAGAAIILSLMLHLGRANAGTEKGDTGSQESKRPGMVVLISPWVTLISTQHRNTESDYLDATTLHEFGLEYSGGSGSIADPLVSPGSCQDLRWWRRASPSKGMLITYGEEEVFALDATRFVRVLLDAGVKVSSIGEEAGIHAWPVASLFLCDSTQKRLKGLKQIVDGIRKLIDPPT